MELKIQTPPWFVPFLEPARYKGAYGGRGSGKSHAFAEAMIEAHVMNADTNSLCVREIQKSLSQSVKKLLEDKIQEMGVSSLFEIQESCIKRKGGRGRIIFLGMQNHTSDSIKSLQGYDRAWVEEAQSLSQHSLEILRPTLREEGSELWFTWNPRSADDPIDRLLRGPYPPPDSVIARVNHTDNPWFPSVLREEMEYDRARDFDKYRHIWEGEYEQNSEARIFKNWRVEDFIAPFDVDLRFGADFGFSADPTVLIRCYTVGRTLYVDYEAWQLRCEIVNLPALFSCVPEADRYPIIADSSRPETISHLQSHGYPRTMAAVKGRKSVEEGIEFLRGYDIVVHSRCRHLIDELTHYSYKTDSLTGQITSVVEDKNNHCIDALRYAVEAVRRIVTRVPAPVKALPSQNFW